MTRFIVSARVLCATVLVQLEESYSYDVCEQGEIPQGHCGHPP